MEAFIVRGSDSLEGIGTSRTLLMKPAAVAAASTLTLLEVGFVLLHLDHEVVQVDELGADGQAAERGLVQDLVEAVVVLDQLGQSALQQEEEVCVTTLTSSHSDARQDQFLITFSETI